MRTLRSMWSPWRLLPLVPLVMFLASTPALGTVLVIRVATIRPVSKRPVLDVLGEVRSLASLTLTAPVTGLLQGPLPPAGDIRRGERIVRIVPPGLAAQLRAAHAQVTYALLEYRRSRRLFRDGVIARETLERRRLLLSEDRASLRSLEAEEQETVLTAPFSGMIRYRVTSGAVVGAGTVIARLQGRGRPWIHALLPPADLRRIRDGTVVAIQRGRWRGHGIVQSQGTSARPLGLVPIIVRIEPESPLLPGEWVTLRIPLEIRTPNLYQVPQFAVVMRGGQAFVWVIRRGRAQRVRVRIVYRARGMAEIQGPLRIGAKVITKGVTRLRPGTRVSVRP